jgi:O-antigen/teichoic acid export membrane protein
METPPASGADRSLGRDSASLFAAFVVGNAGYFVAVLVLARSLGPEGRGTMAFLIVTALILGRVARLGVADATTILAAQRPAQRPVLLANGLVFATLVGALVALVALAVLSSMDEARPAGLGAPELAILAGGAVAAAVVEAGYAFLLGCGRVSTQALVTASASWIYVLMLLGAWATVGLTVAVAGLAWALGQAARATVLVSASVRGIGLGRPNVALLAHSFRFGIRAWFGHFARFLNFRADQVLMGFIASEATLGVYAVAVNASEVLIYLPEAAALALLPAMTATRAEDRRDRSVRVFRVLAAVTAGGALVAAVLGPFVIPAVFGSAFAASIGPFLLLLPGAVGYAALGVFSSTLLASGYPGRSSLGAVVALAIGIALDLVLIPAFGASGAAAAASIAFLAGGATVTIVYRNQARFEWRLLIAYQRADFGMLTKRRRSPTSSLPLGPPADRRLRGRTPSR